MLLLVPQGHFSRLWLFRFMRGVGGGSARPWQNVPRAGSSVTILLCDFGQLIDPLWASLHHPWRDVWTVPGTLPEWQI